MFAPVGLDVIPRSRKAIQSRTRCIQFLSARRRLSIGGARAFTRDLEDDVAIFFRRPLEIYPYTECLSNVLANVRVKFDGSECACRVDLMNELAVVEVHYVGDDSSWFAIGFSDYGERKPADYCVLWSDWRRQMHLQVKCLAT